MMRKFVISTAIYMVSSVANVFAGDGGSSNNSFQEGVKDPAQHNFLIEEGLGGDETTIHNRGEMSGEIGLQKLPADIRNRIRGKFAELSVISFTCPPVKTLERELKEVSINLPLRHNEVNFIADGSSKVGQTFTYVMDNEGIPGCVYSNTTLTVSDPVKNCRFLGGKMYDMGTITYVSPRKNPQDITIICERAY